MGVIIARAATDPNHPSIYVDLRRTVASADVPLALIEFAADEGDLPEGQPNIITRVWGGAAREDCTYRAVHSGIGKFLATEEPDKRQEGMTMPKEHNGDKKEPAPALTSTKSKLCLSCRSNGLRSRPPCAILEASRQKRDGSDDAAGPADN